ncbi:MAG: cytochrome c4 [Gammaproteobacteria bacterium]|nr:cytochrome c4 [Gammaproteobacteria bacterium]MDE2263140.1 cytochrome c4 [Gammaproteobacteria bacterium]
MTRLAPALAAIGALTLTLAGAPAGAQEQAAVTQQAEDTAIGVCGTCHGPEGNSINPMFPRLAGQHAGYLVRQLKSFKEQTRGDPYAIAYMWGMASGLSDDTIDALAQYYAAQKTGPGRSHDPATIARGRDIFEHGIPAQGVPACAACHGPDALGSDAYPRLAGQHAEYILKQLGSFQSNMRKIAVMHGVAQNLRTPEMQAVADYLESLP